MTRLEQTIIKNLIYNEPYLRKVLPFLQSSYFSDTSERLVFEEIERFVQKYNNPPTHEALVINLTEAVTLKEEEVQGAIGVLKVCYQDKDTPTDTTWLVDQSEKFCQDKAIYNAVLESVSILDQKDGKKHKNSIPDILTKALSITFDAHIGHDYLEQAGERFEFYHRKENHIPFDLDFFNKITKGGFCEKTLNIFLAGTGVGKSLVMCHLAAAALTLGKNVLYITLEMAEEQIAKRIDANLLNVQLDELLELPRADYDRKFSALRCRTNGKLIIKEYPTAGASTLHFRALINELALKRSFKPDLLFVDYLNICSSARIKAGGNASSYQYVKSIAEELRGLGVECKVPVISATQTNRDGFDNSDVDLTNTSESFGLPMTSDFMCAIIETEELANLGQYLIKQLKNRYADPNINKRFVIGVDKSRMRLFDVQQGAQQNIQGSGQSSSGPAKQLYGPSGGGGNAMPTGQMVRRTKNFDGVKT
jgi:replicative DNA helicase